MTSAATAPSLLLHARSDQVATLYGQWHRTTLSMALGAALLCTVLWREATATAMLAWVAAILANQAWRGQLARAYRRAAPAAALAPRWGWYWSIGSALAGALWGVAAVAMFPASPPHQALLIVCIFGVTLGGLNLTAVYKPSFYGFVLPALLPLIARVAWQGDQVHLFTALVMGVVLTFVLVYGHHLNDLLTQSLVMRYENRDLIGELTAQTAAAESARNAAENANRAKSQFLAAASHDLRQPLHAMGLFAAALAVKAREPAVQPLVASIHASVEALEALFGQLLDLSRLEAGALHPELIPMPLQPLLSRLAADFIPQAAAAGIALRIRSTRLNVVTDPVLLERILRNLVSNALRYTRRGGIVLGARRRGNDVRIDVIDSGIGIAPADQGRIFDEFVQIDGAAGRTRHGHGLGLGLAIVRRLSALLDHRLEMASIAGRGSRFSVTLARAAFHRPRLEPAPAGDIQTLGERSAIAFANRHIVVIDDDPAVIAAMSALFSTWGAAVIAASDASCASAQLRASGGHPPPIDLIVADLRLADGASGLDAVRTLRQTLGYPVPALIVSGDTSDEAAAEAAAASALLLHKPVLAGALSDAAERLWQRASADRAPALA